MLIALPPTEILPCFRYGVQDMSPGELRRRLKATVAAVDDYCLELRRTLLADVSLGESFVVELLVREAVLNAVIHGGGHDSRNEVACSVERLCNGVRIQVSDQGPGFDWRIWRAPGDARLSSSGHGLNILHFYGSEVRFNRRGNALEIVRWFGGDRDGIGNQARG
jgi:serine/threonine-protein kinase RsbW